MFSKFFIEHPRFAMVVSIVIALAGLISALNLPIKQYPDVAPPQVQVFADYPGADAETLANTLAAPLEEAINGVDDMIYMNSTSSNSGRYTLSVTFKTGTDPDMALVKVQNRVQQATPQLPSEVTARGITTRTSFSNQLGFVALISPNGTRDKLFLLDYANGTIANALKRVPGMGDVQVYGAKYSIRIWLDPERLAFLGLSTNDVAAAISSQNRQASLGFIGAAPAPADSPLVYSLTTRGRLGTAKEFEEIILRATPDGMVKLKDVARVELGAETYNNSASFNSASSAMMALSQGSDANALDVMRATRRTLDELSKNLPSDTQFVFGYDATDYVRATIMEIVETLVLTFLLVVGVCYIFLQDWRVTLVPVAAIPVSLLGTFIGFVALRFSINILTLFGLVLVIGTVVDDAIIVVERVLFVMDRDKCDAHAATIQAMRDVTGPMTATTLVFLAIFVPVAFMSGITGEIYRQFAVTVSVSVCFSLVVALTLSPAMCAHLLHDVKPKRRGPLAWFNSALAASTRGYVAGAMWIARRTVVTAGLFLLIVGACWWVIRATPTSFIPDEDQGAVMTAVQLPEGASQKRVAAVLEEFISRVRAIPGARYAMGIEGYSILGDLGENVGSAIFPLENWSEREAPERSQTSILNQVRTLASAFPEAKIQAFTPPAIMGMGMAGGLDVRLQATLDREPTRLEGVMNDLIAKINQSPEFAYAFSTYTANTPHLFLDIDREKVEMLQIPLGSVFGTLQTYFGTAYVNDSNIGSQVNKVILGADWGYRNRIDIIGNINVTNVTGAQVPMQSFMTLKKILAPRSISRYNLYPSAAITVMMRPGFSSGQGIERILELEKTLPEGYTCAWSGMTYQERESGTQVGLIIGIALLFGYFFLVAQYESWTVPMGVILSLPVALLGALAGIFTMKISLSIYTQLGILLLVGLAAKNAILIIEFAKEQHDDHGLPILQAAAEAGFERFRSVLMTAFTCVFGVFPMLIAKGAGAVSRLHVGTTMFFGMAVATVFGIFLIPGLYVVLQTNRERVKAFISRLFSTQTPPEPEPNTEVES
ncbi:MAG: efflux RND transporter permease subunit [Synergistaceae bacterium]|jgi:hydrophobe/amphiphile efflux-1 (HAE1) family protein|nr:efflux RND transporter permease subunit [Synergistaceae bacterium]